MKKRRRSTLKIRPGDLYEDGAYHPCLCVYIVDDEAHGISLIDGSYSRACDIRVGGIRKLTPLEAWSIRLNGPADASARRRIPKEKRWWLAQRRHHIAV